MSKQYYGGARRGGKTRKTVSDIEHELQKQQLDWCEWQGLVWPELNSIFAVPNQAKRSIAGYKRMKAEGLKTGQWDLCLPVARRGFATLMIENKAPFDSTKPPSKQAKLSKDQIKRGRILEEAGNLCYVIRTFEDFVNLVTWYFGYEDPAAIFMFHQGELWEYVRGSKGESWSKGES